MTTTLPRLSAAILLATLALGACSSSASSGDSSGASAESPAAPHAAARAGDRVSDGPTGATGSDTRLAQPAIVSTGTLTLRSSDVAAARAQVQRIAEGYGGQVAQQVATVPQGRRLGHARLVLRIPAASFADAMVDLEHVGDLRDSRTSSTDVTSQVIDVGERVRSARASLARIRTLLGSTDKIGEVLQVESELTTREADLESLLGQQKHLADQTALSTITVTIDPTGRATVPESEHGFVAGFSGGWHALGGAATVALTVVGALLPWLPVVLVLAVPGWLLARRRSTSRGRAAQDVQ